jgi:hypothetical protein
LIVEHGLDLPALAAATGWRKNDLRDVLVEHGLLQTWTSGQGR